MDLQKFLSATTIIELSNSRFELKKHTPRIQCMDGTSLSVQASQYHHCTPQSNYGPWTHVEIGFPSKSFPILQPYAGDQTVPQENTVFSYVPIDIVEACINECGGICFELTYLAHSENANF